MAIPENAARNADGSLQNPAAWGITPSQGPMPGSFNPASAPQVDWNALAASNFGGLYGGMDPSAVAAIVAQSQRNFNAGNADSNLLGYLNSRDTARNLGLTGANQELDVRSLFGSDAAPQNLSFGPGQDPTQYQTTSPQTTANLGRLMSQLGGGPNYNLGDNMTGFNGATPNYQMFGGLSAGGLANTLRSGDFNSAINSIRQQLATNNEGRMGPNPVRNPFNTLVTNPYSAPQAASTGAPLNPTIANTNPLTNPNARPVAAAPGVGTAPAGNPSINPNNPFNEIRPNNITPPGIANTLGNELRMPGASNPAAQPDSMRGGGALSGAGASSMEGRSNYTAGSRPAYTGPASPVIQAQAPAPNPAVNFPTSGDSSMRGGGAASATNISATGGGNPFADYINRQSGSNQPYGANGFARSAPGNQGSLTGLTGFINNLSSNRTTPFGNFSAPGRRPQNYMWGR